MSGPFTITDIINGAKMIAGNLGSSIQQGMGALPPPPAAPSPFGQVTQLPAPPPMTAPPPIDMKALTQQVMGNLSVPAESKLGATPPSRQHVTPLDYQPYLDQQAKLAPIDRRESDADFKKGRTVKGLAAAASAAADSLQPGHSPGETIARAAAALVGNFNSQDDHHRQENLDYQEAMRQHEEQGMMLKFQAQQAAQQVATANTQIDYDNGMANYNDAVRAQQHHDAYGEQLQAAGRVKAQTAVELARTAQEQDTTQTNVMNANAKANYETNVANAGARAPKVLSFDPATQTVSMQMTDPQGNISIKQMPFGPLGAIEQENQVLGALGPEMGMLKKPALDYAKLSQTNPDLVKTKLILDIIKSGGAERVFDPGSSNISYGMGDARTYGQSKLVDMVTTSKYEQAINNVKEAMKSIPPGSMTPQEATSRFNMMLAAQLSNMVDDASLKRAADLHDPGITEGLKYLGR